jgi:hypothetical protein
MFISFMCNNTCGFIPNQPIIVLIENQTIPSPSLFLHPMFNGMGIGFDFFFSNQELRNTIMKYNLITLQNSCPFFNLRGFGGSWDLYAYQALSYPMINILETDMLIRLKILSTIPIESLVCGILMYIYG